LAIHSIQSEAISRGARMLRTALDPAIARFLDDPDIVEVMLSPVVRLVAHHVSAAVHAGSPRVSAELPETGERFEGLLPPVVAAPASEIRKPAVAVFALNDYVAAGTRRISGIIREHRIVLG
jgi:Flp pilus assembly CpaF family ATPase